MQALPETINCPQCGNSLPIKFRFAKLISCSHCNSTLFIEDEAVKLAGKQAALSEIPSLLKLGEHFQYKNIQFRPVGKVRYAHPIGFWEEWWVIDNSGIGFWISVDEGDFAFEKPFDIETVDLSNAQDLKTGQTIKLLDKDWLVTEVNVGKCAGFEGELPEIIHPGERVPFVHLSGMQGELITLEFSQQKTHAFKGEWVDPYEIKGLSA